MIDRALYKIAFSQEWGRQMRFITGPRQSGKTTLSQLKLKTERISELYYLWDLRSVRNRYKQNELFFTQDKPPSRRKNWVCFDEIHKMPKWKNILKGIYDSTHEHYHFIITGSAKLDISRRAGDSLAGRYFTFHLLPLALSELSGSNLLPFQSAKEAIQRKLDTHTRAGDELSLLLEYSGFPEPFLKQSKKFYAKWSQDYLDTVIKEDIGLLTRISDRENLYDLYFLLPEMVSSPISVSSLASHLELSPPTIKNYLRRLEEFYLTFRIYPYSKNIKRSLLKAPKCYLYNWSQIKDPGKRFENFLAVQLIAWIYLWRDATGEDVGLFYTRNKQKEETDFLLTKNDHPWLLIEAKYSDGTIEGHHFKTQAMLGGVPLLQLCREENIASLQTKDSFRLSASRFFA